MEATEGMEAMTDSDLQLVRALVAACTGAGDQEWWLNENDGGICCGPKGADALEVGYTDMNEADTALVLAAPVLVKKLVAEVAGLRQSLDDALGPHCTGCGHAIDPDVCWCGGTRGADGRSIHAEDHGFVPMGCDCARHPDDRDWKRAARDLRMLLRQATRNRDAAYAERDRLQSERDALTAQLAVTDKECDALCDERDRLQFERDNALRIVRESFALTSAAVEKQTAERIADDIEALGETAHPMIFKGVAERIRARAWRKP